MYKSRPERADRRVNLKCPLRFNNQVHLLNASLSRACLLAGSILACLFLRQISQTPKTSIVSGIVMAGKYHTRGETSKVAFPF